MIVNQHLEGWEVIYHRAHALLAAQIAEQWHQKDLPQRCTETVAAISHHDDLETEWEEDLLTPAGAPADFRLGKVSDTNPVARLRQLVQAALYRSRWVALLVSMHTSYLNEPNRGQNRELDQYLDEQRQQQQQWREDLGVTEAEAYSAYRYLEWCDRLSLILCERRLPADERKLEITTGPDEQRYQIVQYRNGDLTVIPWPFAQTEFSVGVEASYLKQLKFESNQELIESLKQAPREQLTWRFVKQ